jgi:signal peptide peptidase SppA
MAAIIEPQRGAPASGPGMSYMLGSKIFNAPLMMPLTAAQRLKSAIDARQFDVPGGQVSITGPQASKFVGSAAGRSGYRVTDDGIAIVPVSGLLLDRGEWLGDYYGMATTYEGLAEQVRRIIKDSAIRAVILDIDSPGGMAVGCFDFAGAVMTELRKAKRVVAIAQNDACSAAYAIAASAHEVFTTGLGQTGSIGVISMHQSYARALDAAGIDTTIVFAGDNKPLGNPYQALAHNARAEMAAQIDKIYGVFVAHVAKARGLDEAAIRAMEARVYSGADAVRAGLVDLSLIHI